MTRAVVGWAWVAAVAGVSAYALVWGAIWLTGDRSAFVSRVVVAVDQQEEVVAASGMTSFAGVLFGGLPPIPSLDATLVELGAVGLGLAGLAIAGAFAVSLARAHVRGSASTGC